MKRFEEQQRRKHPKAVVVEAALPSIAPETFYKYSYPDEAFSTFNLYHNLSKEDESVLKHQGDGIMKMHFPNHNLKDIAPEALDQLWVAGFLDRAARDPEGMQRRRLRKQLMAIPHEVSVGKSPERKKGGAASIGSNHSLGRDFDDLESQKKGAKSNAHTQAGHSIASSLTPSLRSHATVATGSLMSGMASDISVPSSLFSSSSAGMFGPMAAVTESDLSLRPVVARGPSKRRLAIERVAPYSEANKQLTLQRKLRRSSSAVTTTSTQHGAGTAGLSQKAARSGMSLQFTSDELENLFDLQNREIEAAKRIQRCFRSSRILLPARRAHQQIKAIVNIQRVMRGAMARVLVARYFSTRKRIVTQFQARVRRLLGNLHTRARLAKERRALITMQRMVRGKLGRLRWKRVQKDIAATAIQRLWRGVSDRSLADRLWLCRLVVPVQQIVRRFVAIKRTKAVRAEVYGAALRIQRAFRAFRARSRLGDVLYDREMNYRMDCVAVLTCEEEFAQEAIEKLAKKFASKHYREQVTGAVSQFNDALDIVYRQQNDLVELTRQLETLSPRALTQGWFQELNKSTVELRKNLTKSKVDALMSAGLKVGETERQLEYKVQEIERLASVRDRIAYSRDKEFEERAESFFVRDLQRRMKARRVAIAEERRRWQVRYFTPDGKPDKKRRPGRPWDPSVLAGPERATYCAAGVDVLALAKRGQNMGIKPGSTEAVTNTIAQMSLATYLQQAQAYEQLLNPIADIMARAMGQFPTDADGNPLAETELDHSRILRHRGIAPELSGSNTDVARNPSTATRQNLAAIDEDFEGTDFKLVDTVATDTRAAPSRLKPKIKSARIHEFKHRRVYDNGSGGNAFGEAGRGLASAMSDLGVVPEVSAFDRERYTALSEQKREEDAEAKERQERENFQALVLSSTAGGAANSVLLAHNATRLERIEVKRQRRKARQRPAVIPWELLDQLDGERRKLENEISYVQFNHKY